MRYIKINEISTNLDRIERNTCDNYQKYTWEKLKLISARYIYWSRLTSKCSSWQCLNFLKSTTREGFYTGIISNTRLVECKLNCFLYAGAGIFPLDYRSDTRHLNISQPIRNLNILLLCVVSAKGMSVKLKEYSVKSASLFPSFALFSLPPPLSFLRLPSRLRFTCDTDRPLNLQTETRY